jgi:hypothetical protein
MCAMTAQTSRSERNVKAGIPTCDLNPRRIDRNRSVSRGKDPEGVDREMNAPWVKSRGGSCRSFPSRPSPLPFSPWQPRQAPRKTRPPTSSSSGVTGGGAPGDLSQGVKVRAGIGVAAKAIAGKASAKRAARLIWRGTCGIDPP